MTWLACGVGAIACLPFAPALLRELGEADASSLSWALYRGLFPTAIAFTTWAYALARTTAGRMGSTTYLVPPLAVLMGWLIFGEVPPALALVGGGLCLAGVAVASPWTTTPPLQGPAAATAWSPSGAMRTTRNS